jgi:hypothetical protein
MTEPIPATHSAPDEWVSEEILKATPAWAHLLAYLCSVRGLTWLTILLPLARHFTDVHVKTERNMTDPGKGFRPGWVRLTVHIKLFKRGTLLAEKSFNLGTMPSPYSKLTH